MESERLGFGIRNTFQGIQNPLTIRIQNSIPGIRIPGCGIQETNEEPQFKKYVNIAYESDQMICTLFHFMLHACGYLSFTLLYKEIIFWNGIMLHQVRLVSEGSRLNQNIYDAFYFPVVREYNLALVSVKILLLRNSFWENISQPNGSKSFVDSIVTS